MSKYKLKLNYTPEELKELKVLKYAPFHSTLLVVEITALDGQFKDLHQKWLEIPAVDELKFMTDIYNASWDRVDWPKEKLYVVHDQATDQCIYYDWAWAESGLDWGQIEEEIPEKKTKSEWLAINPAYEAMLEEVEDDEVEEEK